MTQVVDRVGELRAVMGGTVVTPDDPGYDEARRVWNAGIDRRPSVIAYCASTDDVVAAVTFARETSLEISVRSGAHSSAGTSVGDAGICIDLSRMNDVEVDPEVRRARAQGGALLRDLDAATQIHGLAVPAGEIGHTGVAGLTLGGGMGWLTRVHGLTIDNMVSAQVVLADGRVLRAADEENPDLFWALRGGGGNFGIVTEFEFALHEVGPIVQVGMLFYEVERARDVLRLFRDTIPQLPDDMGFEVVALTAPPAPFVPEEYQGRKVVTVVAIGFGDAGAHTELLGRLRSSLTPAFEMVAEMPYTVLQVMFDEANGWGAHAYEKSAYLDADFSDAALEVLADDMAAMRSPMSAFFLYVLTGAYCTTDEDATAFSGGRSPRITAFIIGMVPSVETFPAERAWVRGSYDALAPHALGRGAYVNGLGDDDTHRIPASYGAKYARLAEIKATYDPENVFHRNVNIQPAG